MYFHAAKRLNMTEAIIAASAGLLGTVIGGLISYFIQRDQLKSEIDKIREENKTEFQAEQTAKHFLNHSGYTDRSFETLQNHLGGFEEDELRKILVRAGAIRVYRDDGTEWWRLLSRTDEYISKKNKGQREE